MAKKVIDLLVNPCSWQRCNRHTIQSSTRIVVTNVYCELTISTCFHFSSCSEKENTKNRKTKIKIQMSSCQIAKRQSAHGTRSRERHDKSTNLLKFIAENNNSNFPNTTHLIQDSTSTSRPVCDCEKCAS